MIIAENLTYKYPRASKPAISDLSLSMPAGRIYGLLGANGTGKSTLLYLVAGLLKPENGSLEYNGIPTYERRPSILAETFFVPEEINIPNIKIATYIKHNAPFYPNFSKEQFNQYLTEFRLNGDMHIRHMSMGQKKKVMLAFALACNTSLLLLDEPTNGLDIPGKSEFRRALINATSENRTIIISTHQVRDLDHMLDAVIMLYEKGMILNESIADIQQRFRFIFTTDISERKDALWVQPTAGGYNIISKRNENDPETEVNLENLFEFAYSNPTLFNNPQ